ncbi:GNAT family N-acetyltransferase [Paenibacillus sp. XY044]|uniref:GNAT family N-acetyltransferase n=1 Tax=Paenibacillus sp. XY044 TaxID=2026089 RepID=UPI000B9936F7|nr:GNAT family N-acetyltransferase [Paenibacillus sp. XY044]OZB93610.1 hypothetical protein CJP46_21705 [Paenibacillus sp. XY044]
MKNTIDNVRLALYHPEHEAALEAFTLPKEQHEFTALPGEVIQKALERKERHPIVILGEEGPVGFFVLDTGEDRRQYSDNPNALLLRAFSIDHKHQGHGYATKSLLGLKEFVKKHFRTADEVVLAVNMRNAAARHVYLKAGFRDEGRTRMGPAGPQHILVLGVS